MSGGHGSLHVLGPYSAETVTPIEDPKLAAEIEAVAASYTERRAALLPALHKVQRKYGHISVAAQAFVAGVLGLPASHVQGVVSFYTLFQTRPTGKYHIQVCRTLSCALGGNEEVIAHLGRKLGIGPGETTSDGKFSLVLVECLGACGYAPMFQLNDDYHENLTIESIDRLLDSLA